MEAGSLTGKLSSNQSNSQTGSQASRPELEPWEEVERKLYLEGMDAYRSVLRTVYSICEELSRRLDALS
jgi:hypothetical protein